MLWAIFLTLDAPLVHTSNRVAAGKGCVRAQDLAGSSASGVFRGKKPLWGVGRLM